MSRFVHPRRLDRGAKEGSMEAFRKWRFQPIVSGLTDGGLTAERKKVQETRSVNGAFSPLCQHCGLIYATRQLTGGQATDPFAPAHEPVNRLKRRDHETSIGRARPRRQMLPGLYPHR